MYLQTSVLTSAIDAFNGQQGVCGTIVMFYCHASILAYRHVMYQGICMCLNFTPRQSRVGRGCTLMMHGIVLIPVINCSNHSHISMGYWATLLGCGPVRGVREKGGVESMHSMVQVLLLRFS